MKRERSTALSSLTNQTLGKSYELGRRLREARHRRSWDLAKTEQVTGLSITTLKKIEKGDPRVGWGYFLVLLQVYGLVSELDGLCHASKDLLAPSPQVYSRSDLLKVTFDDDLK